MEPAMQKSLTPAALRQIANGNKAGQQDSESHAAQQASAAMNLTDVQDLDRLARKLCGALVGLAAVSKSMNANTKVLAESIGHLRHGLKGMIESVDQIKVD